jgi:hypothetical protein
MNIGIFGLLTLLLVILKAFGMFSYSWWVVFMPLLVSISVTLFLLAGVLIAAIFLAVAVDKVK